MEALIARIFERANSSEPIWTEQKLEEALDG
jgi:hypothetical protein